MKSFQLREKLDSDDAWIKSIADKLWGGSEIISKEHTYDICKLPNIVTEMDGKPVAFLAYAHEGAACEIVAVYSEVEKQGIATALIDQVKEQAKKEGYSNVWLMTTNDNTDALRFYQKRGFVITAIRVGEIDKQRKRKPIPEIGNHGIPIRDEIELEIVL
jgi:ribosomal protein S18 acetylase RimI-like enzyme